MEKVIHKPHKNHVGHSAWSEEPTVEQLAEVEKISDYFISKMEQPKRVQRKRSPGWRMPPNTVSVCRPGKYGNPYRIGVFIEELDRKMDRDDCVHSHRRHLETMRKNNPAEFEAFIAPLRGKNLACFCPLDCACHGDTLLEMANQ